MAQVTGVRLQVHIPLPDTLQRPVYVAGSFNHWYAGDSLYKMEKKGEGIYTLVLPVYIGRVYEYKYTRGNWDRVELAANDSTIKNRQFFVTEQLLLTDTVEQWKKPSPRKEPAARASAINAKVDEMKAGLNEQMEKIQQLLKAYMTNMLAEQPKASLHSRLDRKAARKLGEVYKKITGIVWDVLTKLSPEEKQKLRGYLDSPEAQKNLMQAFGKVLDGSAQ